MVLGKHFIGDIKSPVERALKCLLEVNPGLGLIESHKGGSGHEPAHAGFVGNGMLDIAVAGDIFASPSAAQILVGLKAIKGTKGTLMIVKNYTGDKLNFGLAAQKARSEGQEVSVVFVNEDASLDAESLVGRRGLAGTVFVHKIAGAAASRGLGLSEVTRIAQKVADSVTTVGVSLDRCSVPGRGGQEGLGGGELEYGMGIHNEPGVLRTNLTDLSSTVSKVLSYLLSPSSPVSFHKKDTIAVLINNLGGLSILELNVIAQEVLTQLSNGPQQFTISRKYIGSFMTSLDGPGFSITILKHDDEILGLLDEQTEVQAWPKQFTDEEYTPVESRITQYSPPNKPTYSPNPHLIVPANLLTKISSSLLTKIQSEEPTITKYDTLVGDGDCGTTLLKGVTSINDAFKNGKVDTTDLSTTFESIAEIVESSMGGTSGAIYGIFLNAFVNNLRNSNDGEKSLQTILQKSLSNALQELCTFTLARKGHRTLMDTLIPFVETFQRTGDLNKAVEEAGKGCEETKKMEAKLGRASYVSHEQVEKDGGVMDPGALGLKCILEVLGQELA
ncbi:hypothetical protein AOL_s00004g426 [Orbilia oligospora ATCC 24927]|uniref:Dihydroxyacetone kinase 2 n=1 Tax=Arthrobotrys oligospora (strain ATCC 24927 / CBS 115.81 / DSM 1491) TaxID=756982 RepID=G1WYR5_ARTOA|nr:hypothetical protein AOL_s00004g426 [Orbilia oligospora ATCC 24927]EGX53767.1 hypothetical protein AOL_s00004g426 [Orbilia oligospora ATCC 24927]